jgi:hypothetical protein
VRVGPPTGRLPYADREFDLVYTSEVLVHVRPEHLEGVLSELLRIGRSQLLHIEPARTTEICRDAHDGCWNHDIAGAYAKVGKECEVLQSGYRLQAPYRVMLSGAAPFTWSPVTLELMRRFERDALQGLAEAAAHAPTT